MNSQERKATLAGRVFAAVLAVSVISATAASIVSAYFHQVDVLEEALIELGAECDVVASTLNHAPDEIAELSTIELGEMRATLVGPDGTVLYDSVIPTGGLSGHESRPEIAEALRTGEGSSIRSSDTIGRVSLYQARRLESGNVVRISVDRSGVLTILARYLRIIAAMLILLVLLSYVASRFLSRRLVKPILEMDAGTLAEWAPYEELQPLATRLAEQQAELISQMEELRQADAARREFTANVTHELKTPIASIMGASELMRDGFVLEEDVPDFAARINSESQRLAALVNDILTLSKLDESERTHTSEPFGSAEPVDLMTITHDVSERMYARADVSEVTLTVEGESAMVLGYPRMLDELISNLCSNAIRYNKAGGSVRITVGFEGGSPMVRVADTGIGIPEEAQAKVFERFYRVETSRSRASGGTGLGLAIVKHAAMLHGASVELDSKLGEGTVVTVRFPNKEDMTV